MYLCSSGCIGLLWRHKQQTTTTTLYMDYIYEKFLFFFLCIDALFFFLSPKEATRLFFLFPQCTLYLYSIYESSEKKIPASGAANVEIDGADFLCLFFRHFFLFDAFLIYIFSSSHTGRMQSFPSFFAAKYHLFFSNSSFICITRSDWFSDRQNNYWIISSFETNFLKN